MKKSGLCGVTLGAIALLAAACSSGNPASGEDGTLTLRVGAGISNQNLYWTAGMEPWMDRVTELTDGKVQFESFTSGELVEVTGELDALNSGTLDVALIMPIFQPDQFPLAEVSMLPVGDTDVTIGSKAWKALMESEVELADGKTFYDLVFADNGLKAFPIHATQAHTVSTTGQTFDSLSNIQSLQLRTSSRSEEIYADIIGANTVSMPNVDTFDALSRGSLDGGFTSVADWGNYGLQDLFEYTVTGINFGHFTGNIAMTDETWSSLPTDVQKAMDTALEETYPEGAEAWLKEAEKIREYNETEVGGKFVDVSDLPADVEETMVTAVEQTWHDWIDLMEEQGAPGKAAALLWRDLFVAEGGEVPPSIAELE